MAISANHQIQAINMLLAVVSKTQQAINAQAKYLLLASQMQPMDVFGIVAFLRVFNEKEQMGRMCYVGMMEIVPLAWVVLIITQDQRHAKTQPEVILVETKRVTQIKFVIRIPALVSQIILVVSAQMVP